MNERAIRLGLVLIVAIAALVRSLHFMAIAGTPFPEFPRVFGESDMHAFLEWAQRIRLGDWLGRDTYHPYFSWMQAMAPIEHFHRWWGGKEVFHQSPLYPYWLAVVLSMTDSLTLVLLVQLLVGVAQPVVVFALAKRIFDPRVALLAALGAALYGPLIFFQATLLRDWLAPILDPLALVALAVAADRDRWFTWLAGGAAIGLSVLARETGLLLLPVAIVWLLTARGSGWKCTVRRTILIGIGFSVCLMPVFARNAAVGAPWFKLSAGGPGSFPIGWSVDAAPVGHLFPTSLKGIMERSEGKAGAVVVETLKTHPDVWSVGRLLVVKIRAILQPFEAADNLSYYYGLDISPVLRATPGWGLLVPLALTGLFFTARWSSQRLVLVYLGATAMSLLITVVHARYRLPIVPILLLYAAAIVIRLADMVTSRLWRQGAAVVALLGLVILVQRVAVPVTPPTEYTRPQEYLLAAVVYDYRGSHAKAAAEIERLIDRARQNPTLTVELPRFHALRDLFHGLARIDQGDLVGAERRLVASVTADPSLARAHYTLAVLYSRDGRDPDTARAHFQRVLELEPVGPLADSTRSRLQGSSH